MPITRTFTVAELEAKDLPWKALANYEGEAHRWYVVRHLVFEHGGEHWMVDYMDPASELQEGQACWDFDSDDDPDAEIVATKVERVERVVERWEPVVAPSGAPGRAHANAADDTTVELGTIEGFQVNVPITGIDAAALERLKALPDTEITLEGTFTEYGMEKMVLGPAIKAAWEEAQTAEDAESLMLILQRLAAVAGVKD